jgi:GPH family glycoside/pentoside/hexuronide:cation symporter
MALLQRSRLSARVKWLFAFNNIGEQALVESRNVWLVYFYAPPSDAGRAALLKLSVVSVLLFAGKLVEAFDDVLVGFWSDRTRSRWGRRLPYVLLASPLWALCAFLAFAPPRGGTATIALYFFAAVQLFHLFSALSTSPYEALIPELATTSAERVGLVAASVYCGVAGAALGLVGSGLLKDAVGFRAMALAMAALALLTRYVGLAGVWSRASRATPPVTLTLRESLRLTCANRNFLRFVPGVALFQSAAIMVTALLPFYASAILGKSDEGVWVSLLTAVVIGAMVCSVPLFTRLARRGSKRAAYQLAMLGAALAAPLLALPGLLPGPPDAAQALLAMALLGAPLAGVYLFPSALVADIIDHDTLATGQQREATFYGAQHFIERAAGSLAPLVLALILLLGDTAAHPLGVRLVGPVAGLMVLAGYVVFRLYDLPDEVGRNALTPRPPLPTLGEGE